MKLCKSNIFTNKLLIFDPEPTLKYFSYDADVEIPRVLVSGTPEITTQNFGDHCGIRTFRFESEKQFNLLALNVILKACEINNHKVKISEIDQHFTDKGMRLRWCLMSEDYKKPNQPNLPIIRVKGLKNTQLLFLPEPDFLGVVCAGGEELDHYGIGIINSNAPVLIEINDE